MLGPEATNLRSRYYPNAAMSSEALREYFELAAMFSPSFFSNVGPEAALKEFTKNWGKRREK